MPNPVKKTCLANVWTLIAEDQIFGFITKLNTDSSRYLYTYRLTGGDAPTSRTEGTELFIKTDRELRIFLLGCDIYVMSIDGKGAVGYEWTY